MLRLRIAGLPFGHFTEQRQVPVTGLDLSAWPEYVSPVTVDLEIERTAEAIVVAVRWKSDVEFACDRCAVPFQVQLEDEVSLVYTFNPKMADTDDENLFLVSESTQEVDMRESLRQSMILALPLKRLCHDGCRGLCPQCGADLNMEICNCSAHPDDPRWDKLKQFLK